MSQHEDAVSLRQMRDHAREAVDLAANASRIELERHRLLQLGLIRLIEVIGEAARRVSMETRADHPQVPWAEAISMRNRLIHGYDFLDLDILWQTVTEDLPALFALLEAIVPPDE